MVDGESARAIAHDDLPVVTGDMATGFYYDLTFETYCKLPGVNASTLCWGDLSDAHMKAAIDGLLQHDSPDMAFGRALHARLLEPESYQERFVVSPGCEAVLSSGKNKGQMCGKTAKYLLPSGKFACGTHTSIDEQSANILTADEAARVEGAAAAVKEHDVVKLLRQSGGFECTAVWQRDGVLCRGRLDKLCAKVPAIVDLKKITVGRGKLRTIELDILNYNYDIKAAWYVDGVERILGARPAFVWIFVEDGPPYGVRVLQADADTLAVGALKANDLFERYKRANESGVWPGYSSKVEFGGLPSFEKDKWRGMIGGGR